MKAILRSGFLALAMMLAPAVPAHAGPWEDGMAAYDRGDYATALEFWRPLAEQGDSDAQYNLGIMYNDGRGVPQDYAEAVKWWHKAAEQDNVYAQVKLAAMYCSGEGVPQDTAEGLKWWHKAAEQGDAKAQLFLGNSYLGGMGVPQDYVLAHFWFNLAAAQARQKAQEGRVLAASLMTSNRRFCRATALEIPKKARGREIEKAGSVQV